MESMEDKAQALSEWSQNQLGMTAEVLEDFDDIRPFKNKKPVQYQYSDLKTEKEKRNDKFSLLKDIQLHKCSGFCMRVQKSR